MKPFARNNLSAAAAWMGAFPDEVRVTGVVTLSDWEAGRDADAESLLDDFRLMAENIMAFGVEVPKSEVNYEQSIIAPAANFLCEIFLVTKGERPGLGARLRKPLAGERHLQAAGRHPRREKW